MSRLTLYKDNFVDATVISNRFIDEYMKDANDAQIKVYLYLIRMMSANLSTSIAEIADKFNHTEKDVLRALAYWEKQHMVSLDYDENGAVCGLHLQNPDKISCAQIVSLTPVTKNTPSVPDKEPVPPVCEKPVYSADDLRAFKSDEASSQIIFIAEQYLGKTLSANEIRSLLFISRDLHFSTELTDYLIEYCVGKGKREMRYIEKVAINWAEEHITTVRQAKNRSTRYDKIVYTIMKALGRNSDPTDLEAAFIQKWNREYAFSVDIILAACERTVLSVEKHRFEYTDGILNKWRKAGVKNKGDITLLEAEFSKSKSGKPDASKNNTFNDFNQRNYDYDALEKELLSN